VAAKTGHVFVSVTDSVEIPPANTGFSIMLISLKVSPTVYDNSGQPDMETIALKPAILPFSVVGRCCNRL